MPRLAANVSTLFKELPFLERFEAAAQAGFRAVEYQYPYERDARDVAARARDACLPEARGRRFIGPMSTTCAMPASACVALGNVALLCCATSTASDIPAGAVANTIPRVTRCKA